MAKKPKYISHLKINGKAACGTRSKNICGSRFPEDTTCANCLKTQAFKKAKADSPTMADLVKQPEPPSHFKPYQGWAVLRG